VAVLRLRLIVPGLPWPGADRDVQHSAVRAPTLSRWLARADRLPGSPSTVSASLWAAAGGEVASLDTPAGALALLGDGGDPGSQWWIRADPVPLHVGRTGLALASPRLDGLTPADASALAESLRTHFGADLPPLVAAHPQRWYLGLPEAPGLETVDPERAIGSDLARGLPRGPGRARWIAWLNEVQMLWHEHPVNLAREARGERPAASLWLHGAGTLATAPRAPWARSCGPSPLLAGFAIRCKAEHVETPPDRIQWLLEPAAGETLALEPAALDAVWEADAARWRAALEEIDARLFAPADRALASGRVREIRLCLPAPQGGLDLRIDRATRLRLWRRPSAGLRLDA